MALARAISQLDELFLAGGGRRVQRGQERGDQRPARARRCSRRGPRPRPRGSSSSSTAPSASARPPAAPSRRSRCRSSSSREMNIVDTPGTKRRRRGSRGADARLRAALGARALRDLRRSAVHGERARSSSRRSGDWGKKVVVAVNKIDIPEGPADVEKVVEFVRDKLRELLGLRPEVFGVSARQTWKAKTAGATCPTRRATASEHLEAYLRAHARSTSAACARQAREPRWASPTARSRSRRAGRNPGWRRSPRTRRRSRRSRA